MQLDVYGIGGYVSIGQRGWGGQKLPGGVDRVEADGGGSRCHRCQSFKACASEWVVRGDAGDDGNHNRVLWVQWGGSCSPELLGEFVGAENAQARNQGSLVAERGG